MKIFNSNEFSVNIPTSLRELLNKTYGRDWIWFVTGSFVITGVKNPKDVDILVLVLKEKELITHEKQLFPYFLEPSYESDKLMRLTSSIPGKGINHKLDILITDDSEYFKRWYLATGVCVDLNIVDKKERKSIFEFITKQLYKDK